MEIVVRRIAGWSPDLSHSELTELYHHGIKGQKWGVRRFQNSDGTLTAAGKARYGSSGKYGSFMDDYGAAVKKAAGTARTIAGDYAARTQSE